MENDKKIVALSHGTVVPVLESKKLPYNIEAEQIVIGSVMSNDNSYFKVIDLKTEHFYEPLHQKIWGYIEDFYRQGKDITPVTLKEYLQDDPAMIEAGGASYLLRMCGISSSQNIYLEKFAAELKNLMRKRKFAGFIAEYAGQIDANTDVDAAMSKMESVMFEPSKRIKLSTEKMLAVSIAQSLTEKLPCFSTGYPLLDNALAGGLYQRKSYWLIARKKAGKTTMLGSISHNLSRAGVPHLYIAIEMGASEIYQRTIAYSLRRNPIVFYDEEARKDQKFQLDVGAYAHGVKGSAIFADAPGIKFQDLKRLVISSVKKYKLKGVIVDYLQIIKGRPKGESKADFLYEIAQWFEDIGKQEDIFTLGAAQENQTGGIRDGEGAALAGDVVIYLKGPDPKNDPHKKRWMEIGDTRYTISMPLGSEVDPTFKINTEEGLYLEQYDQEAGKQKLLTI